MSSNVNWLLGLLSTLATLNATGGPTSMAQEPAATSVAVRESAATRSRRRTLPDRVDLRPVFETRGLRTRVQGKRGTCSAFVLTGAIEYAVAGKQGGVAAA